MLIVADSKTCLSCYQSKTLKNARFEIVKSDYQVHLQCEFRDIDYHSNFVQSIGFTIHIYKTLGAKLNFKTYIYDTRTGNNFGYFVNIKRDTK